MALETIQDIERAIDALTPEQLQELYSWLDRRHPQAIDTRLADDLASGRLDAAIDAALKDEKNGRTRAL